MPSASCFGLVLTLSGLKNSSFSGVINKPALISTLIIIILIIIIRIIIILEVKTLPSYQD